MKKTLLDLRPLWFILLGFLLLATSYSVVNPLHEGTDELRHYRFVRYLVQHKSLPVQGLEPCRSQSHHPPLFYLVGAILTAPINTGRDVCHTPEANPFWGYRYWEIGRDNKNMYLHGVDEAFPWHGEALAARVVRFFNVLLGAITVVLTYLTARTIWPQNKATAGGAAAFLAFSPMFLYMSGTINNDVIAALSGAAVIYTSARLLHDPQGLSRQWGVICGAVYALALMSKFSLAPVVVIFELVFLLAAWPKKQWRLWLEVNLLLVFTAGLLAGWWFVRNYQIYGDPTGFKEVTELWGVRTPSESVGLVFLELPNAWSSLWGRFGFGQIPLPQLFYSLMWWLTLGAAAGLVLISGRTVYQQRRVNFTPTGLSLCVLALMVALFFAVLFAYMLVSPAGAMGRFFFPALPSLSILLFAGLAMFVGRLKSSFLAQTQGGLSLFAGGVQVVMAGVALWALVGYLAPAYARPPAWEPTAVFTPAGVQFDQMVKLQGYNLKSPTITPGETIELELFWEVLNQPIGNFWLFVHFTDEVGTMVTQRDTHPGLGNFPSSQWLPGDKFIDTVWLPIPETAYPGRGTLTIGLYAPNSYRLGITDAQNQFVGDALLIAEIPIHPKKGDFPNQQDYNFEQQALFLGYEYQNRVVPAGETTDLTIYWQLLAQNNTHLRTEIWVIKEDQSYQWSITEEWGKKWPQQSPHQSVSATYSLVAPPQTPAGVYLVQVRLFDIFTSNPLNLVAEDGHWIDNHIQLAKIVVPPSSQPHP